MDRSIAVWGSVLAFIAVGLGAFGAHGLREHLSPASMAIYQTGSHYHLIHALGLVAVAAVSDKVRTARFVSWCFIFGILVFSGSLYLLAITEKRWLGAITPIGGVCFLAGWATLAYGAARSHKAGTPGSSSA